MIKTGTALGATFAVLMASTSFAADVTARITLQLPLKNHLGQNLMLFKEEVERQSEGEIEIQIYDSAQLYRDKEVPAAVGSGAIEMGVVSLTQYVGYIPAVDIFYLPFLFNSPEKVRKATEPGSPVRTPIEDAIKDTGATVLWWQPYGGTILLSKGDGLRMPETMEGKKARVFGKTLGDFVTENGGAPTLISGSEQYLAYQRGTVDIGMTGVSGVKSRRLWEVMDTLTVTNHADIEFVVVTNSDWWDELSDDHRAIMKDAAIKAEISVRNDLESIEADAYAAAVENGMQVVELSPTEIEAWRTSSAAVYDSFLDQAGDLGAQILKAAQQD